MEFMTHFQIVKQSKLQSFVGGKIQKSYLLVSFHFILPPSASASKHQLINSCMQIKLWPACDFKVIESLSCATATKGSYKLLLIGASKKKNCLSTKTEIEEEQSNTIQSVDRLEQRQTIYTNQTRRKTSWKTQIKCTNTTNQKLNEKPDWNQMEMEINQSVFCINVCMSHGVAQPLSRSLCVVVHYIHLCKTMFTSWRLLKEKRRNNNNNNNVLTTYFMMYLWVQQSRFAVAARWLRNIIYRKIRAHICSLCWSFFSSSSSSSQCIEMHITKYVSWKKQNEKNKILAVFIERKKTKTKGKKNNDNNRN